MNVGRTAVLPREGSKACLFDCGCSSCYVLLSNLLVGSLPDRR
jgi:hypothetical protein